eukprot:130662-Rhodomonas_salina.1
MELDAARYRVISPYKSATPCPGRVQSAGRRGRRGKRGTGGTCAKGRRVRRCVSERKSEGGRGETRPRGGRREDARSRPESEGRDEGGERGRGEEARRREVAHPLTCCGFAVRKAALTWLDRRSQESAKESLLREESSPGIDGALLPYQPMRRCAVLTQRVVRPGESEGAGRERERADGSCREVRSSYAIALRCPVLSWAMPSLCDVVYYFKLCIQCVMSDADEGIRRPGERRSERRARSRSRMRNKERRSSRRSCAVSLR